MTQKMRYEVVEKENRFQVVGHDEDDITSDYGEFEDDITSDYGEFEDEQEAHTFLFDLVTMHGAKVTGEMLEDYAKSVIKSSRMKHGLPLDDSYDADVEKFLSGWGTEVKAEKE